LIWATPLFVVVSDVEGVAPFCVVVVDAGAVPGTELAAAAGAAAAAAGVELSGVAGWLCANAEVAHVVPSAADSAISAQSSFLIADAKVSCFMIPFTLVSKPNPLRNYVLRPGVFFDVRRCCIF
jgi:hypothetical protein